MSSIQLFSNQQFSVRSTIDENGMIWFVARDVAEALEYEESSISSINKLCANVPDEWKGRKRFLTPGGEQEMLCLTEQGVYFFLGRSDKPKALPYQMWIAGDVVPSIRKTGSYSVNKPAEDKELKHKELDGRRLEIDLERAKFLQHIIEVPPFPLTDESKAVIEHEAFKLVTGHEYLGMLSQITEKWYTAEDIGKVFGISANMVGRIAKSNHLKPEQGQSNKYGRWIYSKSKYCSREVPSFIYSEDALDWFREYHDGVCSEVQQ
jgi:prophage antirepressor-like protein